MAWAEQKGEKHEGDFGRSSDLPTSQPRIGEHKPISWGSVPPMLRSNQRGDTVT